MYHIRYGWCWSQYKVAFAFAVGSVTGCFSLAILFTVTFILAVAKIPRWRVTSVLKSFQFQWNVQKCPIKYGWCWSNYQVAFAFAAGSVTGCFSLAILCPVTFILAVARPPRQGVTSVLKHYAALLWRPMFLFARPHLPNDNLCILILGPIAWN